MSTRHLPMYICVILLLLYFLSGVASLSYEVLWVRMLSLQFGVSIFGVVVTVASFMAGLGAGSLLGLKVLRFSGRPLLTFALLEAIVAIMAVSMPWVMQEGESLISGELPLSVWYMWQMGLIGILLFIPALLMGAGFPVILEVIKNTRISIGHIYGINALGASIGALLPLILLPIVGWLNSLYSIASLGLFIAIVAALLSGNRISQSFLAKDKPLQSSGTSDLPSRDTSNRTPEISTLLTYAGIGAAALVLEVCWTRLFGMIFLRTEFVLAIILAIFLSGMGIGSLVARRLRHDYWFTVLPVLASLFSVLGLWVMPWLSSLVDVTRSESLASALLWQGSALALVTMPVTLVFGAWLPLLSRRYANNESSAALLYGVNSLGAAAGALVAGFVLTPLAGTSATLVLAGLLTLVLGLRWAHTKKAWVAVPLVALAALPVINMPAVSQLLPQMYKDARDIYYHEDAIAITHVVERKDGQRLLLADLQRMDASSDPSAIDIQKNQARLPLLLHPEPKSVLFLGLGTGISAAGSLPFPDLHRTAVELSQGAIDAAGTWFGVVNNDVIRDMDIVRDDARHFLMSGAKKFDVVIGDLFHPDLVGRSALLSVQQFQRAKNSLTHDGVFVQWLALNQFDVASLDIVLRSFQQVFPEAVIFVDAFRLALVGTEQFSGATAMLKNIQRLESEQQDRATGGEGVWTWLGRYWGKPELSTGVVQEEWAPRIEYQLPHARFNGDLDLAKMIDYLLQKRPSLQGALKQLEVMDTDFSAFERAWAGTELGYRSWLALLTNKPEEGQRLLRLAYQANPKDRWNGFAVADGVLASLDAGAIKGVDARKVLESVLRVRPDHAEALERLWRLETDSGNTRKAGEYRARFAAVSPLDSRLKSTIH